MVGLRKMRPGTEKDVSTFGTDWFPEPAGVIGCNTSGTYRIYRRKDQPTAYQDRVFKAGLEYTGPVVKITTTGDAAVTSGYIKVIF